MYRSAGRAYKLRNREQRDVFEGTIATVPNNFYIDANTPLLPSDFADYRVCDERIRAKGYDFCNVQCFCMMDCKYEFGEYGCQRGMDIPNMEAFGQCAIIVLNPEKFVKKIIEAAEKAGYAVLTGPVSYHPLKKWRKNNCRRKFSSSSKRGQHIFGR